VNLTRLESATIHSYCTVCATVDGASKPLNMYFYRLNARTSKRSFYRSFNGIFGRVRRIASNEVIVQLVKS